MLGILDVLAFRYSVYISDLRLISVVRRHVLQDLFFFPNLRCFSLNEWSEAVSYLSGQDRNYTNYNQLRQDLKCFSLNEGRV